MFNHYISNDPKYATIHDLQAVNSTGLYMHFGHHNVQGKSRRLRAYFVKETKKLPHPINSDLSSDLNNTFFDLISLEQSKQLEHEEEKNALKRPESTL